MSVRFVCAFALMLCIGAPASLRPQTVAAATSPAQAYVEALNAMAILPQPKVINFTATVALSGAGLRLDRSKDPAGLQVGVGRAYRSTDSWPATYHVDSGAAFAGVAGGPPIRVRSSLFKPTWRTALSWVRYGFNGPDPVVGGAQAVPAPAASDEPATGNDDEPKVVGRIQSFSSAAYVIEDGEPELCSSSKAGRHLKFTPRRDPATHPLTDMIVEPDTMRVCSMRFRVNTSKAVSVTGFVSVDFGDRAGYWLATGGTGDYQLRFFGIGMKHASMTFAIRNITVE